MRNDFKVFIIGGVAMFIGSVFINNVFTNAGFIQKLALFVYVLGAAFIGASGSMGRNRDGKLIEDE